MAPVCRIVSSDYLDKDVFLNIRCFYAAAGYLISREKAAADLLVVLRGDNSSSDHDFSGIVHVYDYVKEYKIDWASRYPQAVRLFVISLPDQSGDPAGHRSPAPIATLAKGAAAQDSASQTQHQNAARLIVIQAYLPVIPELWAVRWQHKRNRPLHISNYKRMAGDAYQQDLLALIQGGAVQVHGGRWDLVGVRAQPLSYRQANRSLAQAACCFGLMWPYQRGRTLSGRMWQAPLNGCFVISEIGTDILGCPGVLERPRFEAGAALPVLSSEACRQLQLEARRFWAAHTDRLAQALGLGPACSPSRSQVRRHRLRLLLWDLEFRLERLQQQLAGVVAPPSMALRSRLARLARRLGLHPDQRPPRRGP